MSKDPAFLLYSSDFLTGTMFFTNEQVGKYMRLLCAQHQNGPLTEDQMLNICGNKDDMIFKKFKKEKNGLYQNQRLTDEIEKRKKYSDSRRKNIGNRWNKGDKPLSGKKIDNIHMNNICNTHVIHMENENKDENKDKDINKKENEKYTFISEKLKFRVLERKQMKITDRTIKKWNNTVRLMVERDKRTESDIVLLIDECHDMPPNNQGFTWANNILSMDKLRLRWNEGKIAIGMNKTNKNKTYGII